MLCRNRKNVDGYSIFSTFTSLLGSKQSHSCRVRWVAGSCQVLYFGWFTATNSGERSFISLWKCFLLNREAGLTMKTLLFLGFQDSCFHKQACFATPHISMIKKNALKITQKSISLELLECTHISFKKAKPRNRLTAEVLASKIHHKKGCRLQSMTFFSNLTPPREKIIFGKLFYSTWSLHFLLKVTDVLLFSRISLLDEAFAFAEPQNLICMWFFLAQFRHRTKSILRWWHLKQLLYLHGFLYFPIMTKWRCCRFYSIFLFLGLA